MNDLMTPRETAELLRVEVRTLETWRRRGSGPAYVRVGQAVRYSRTVVLAWITDNAVEPKVSVL